MGDTTKNDGIFRRELLQKGAIATVGAWTAPVIIGSLVSPAAASSVSFPTSCSYGLIVFTVNGAGPYIVKIASGSATCTSENSTSNDDSFNAYSCGGSVYSGGSAYGTQILKDNVAVPVYPGSACPTLLTINGSTISANSAGVSILFAVSHHGPSSGWQGSKFYPVCGPSTSVTLNC